MLDTIRIVDRVIKSRFTKILCIFVVCLTCVLCAACVLCVRVYPEFGSDRVHVNSMTESKVVYP